MTAGVAICSGQDEQVFRLSTHAALYTTLDHHEVRETLALAKS
jgi:hypothetical protein